ncbi:hypothetical protein GX563_11855 [Candidatus Bathyarchaeota archaeon]|nr:hypothetical protein [Candidatus Bathyarchaeota archaeon]
MIIVVIGILLVNLTRPTNFIPHIIVLDIAVLVVYLIIPIKFIYQAIPALLFSIGEAAIIMFTFQEIMPVGLDTALFSILFVNIVGHLVASKRIPIVGKLFYCQKNVKKQIA